MLAAFSGTFAGDQLFFWIGRKKGISYLKKKPTWQPRVDKVRALLEKHHASVILGFRFLYGLRSVTPFVIGVSGFGPKRFVLFNAVGVLLWAVVVGTGGFLVGNALERLLGDAKHYERLVLIVMALIGLATWFIYLYRRKTST